MMFEKLIESESREVTFGKSSRYFILSTIVVGILFLTAVVFSLYAADIGVNGIDSDLALLYAPLTLEEPEISSPDKLLPESPKDINKQETSIPQRTSHIARIDESQKAPDSVSVVNNTVKARPRGIYEIGTRDFDPPGGFISNGKGNSGGTGLGSNGGGEKQPTRALETNVPAARPIPKPVKKPEPIRVSRVINGAATYLPKPPYPPVAINVGASGDVAVQVTIDETGRVVSAKAISGHPMLRAVSVAAARKAKFDPTLLTNVPIKVTGVITYKFKRN